MLRAFIRLCSEEPKGVQNVVNLVFELSSVQVIARGKDGKVTVKTREEISGNTLELVLCVERYLKHRSDYSKSKIDNICRHILP